MALMEMYFSKQAPQNNSWVTIMHILSETAENERGPGIWVYFKAT